MRIIAGEYKGRIIGSPSEKTTRPTTDRVRESIFSSVYSRLPELDAVNVLDAFAGSGALGIEALSRGARSCAFVEQDARARKVLSENLETLRIDASRYRIISSDAFDTPRTLAGSPLSPWGLVLLDPPYACAPAQVRELLESFAGAGSLEAGCVIVYEHALDNREAVASEFAKNDSFEQTGQKKYGKIAVTYLLYTGNED